MSRAANKVVLLAALLIAFSGSAPSAFSESQQFRPIVAIAKTDKKERVADWFAQYDQIRHQAQMSDYEREQSRQLLTQGLAASLTQSQQGASDKAAARALLTKMVDRYHRALAQLSGLSEISETRKLQLGYEQYFKTAGDLFSDYLKIQGNLFATDANGNTIVGQLAQRKADLESLDAVNKDLDCKVRAKYQIPPYAY